MACNSLPSKVFKWQRSLRSRWWNKTHKTDSLIPQMISTIYFQSGNQTPSISLNLSIKYQRSTLIRYLMLLHWLMPIAIYQITKIIRDGKMIKSEWWEKELRTWNIDSQLMQTKTMVVLKVSLSNSPNNQIEKTRLCENLVKETS